MEHSVLKKVIPITLAVILALWIFIAAVDFTDVRRGNVPTFCIKTESYAMPDGGSWAHYAGLGYSFNVRGEFAPDALQAVYEYNVFIFGKFVLSGT